MSKVLAVVAVIVVIVAIVLFKTGVFDDSRFFGDGQNSSKSEKLDSDLEDLIDSALEDDKSDVEANNDSELKGDSVDEVNSRAVETDTSKAEGNAIIDKVDKSKGYDKNQGAKEVIDGQDLKSGPSRVKAKLKKSSTVKNISRGKGSSGIKSRKKLKKATKKPKKNPFKFIKLPGAKEVVDDDEDDMDF